MIGLSLGVLSWRLYAFTESDLRRSIAKELIGIAATGSLLIPPSPHEDIYLNGDDLEGEEAFNFIRSLLLKIQSENGLEKPVYTMRRAFNYDTSGEMEFVVMTNLVEGRPYTGNRIASTKYVEQAYSSSHTITTDLYEDEEGTWISAIAPIKDDSGDVIAVLSIDRHVGFFEEALTRVIKIILGTAVFSLVLGGVLFSLALRPLVRRIARLVDATRLVASGDLEQRITMQGHGEIRALADSFNAMTSSLSESVVSRSYFENIINSMNEVLVVADDTGEIRSVNEAATQLLGYTEDELLGMQFDQLFEGDNDTVLNEDDRDQLARNGTVANLTRNLETRSGKTIPSLLSCSVLTNDGGESIGTLFGAQDITEIRKAEEEIRKSHTELEATHRELQKSQTLVVQAEKLAGLGQMAAGVAHEINSPIGFVLSNLGTMQGHVSSMKSYLEAYAGLAAGVRESDAAVIKTHLQRVTDLAEEEGIDFILEDVNDLVKESYVGAGRVRDIVQGLRKFASLDQAEACEENVNDGIESTLLVMGNEGQLSVRIHKDFGELPVIKSYRAQLNQVYLNLLLNAIHATTDKGDITIQTRHEAGDVVVRVVDTGLGIEQEHLGKVFDPFFTTKPVGTGTGLGLAIVHGIIEKHNGSIDVESDFGKGTTFTIKLPTDGTNA